MTRQRIFEIIEKSQGGDRAGAVFDSTLMGIGLIAMPSGIISMGLIKEAKKEKKRKKKERRNDSVSG